MRPFEEFVRQALREFERQTRGERVDEHLREQRLRGARDFAVFLLGRPVDGREARRRRR
ncbi:MAG: hypothetical protein ACREJ9_00340 [Candidatus Rokuibacteriota bacterium]